MTYLYRTIISGLGCFLLTILLVPLSMKVATLIGALDYPGKIKIHSIPLPRFGGMAIFSSIIIISILFPSLISQINNGAKILIYLSVGVIFLTGVLDDVNNLKPKTKFLFQIFSALLAVLGLYRIFGSLHIVYFVLIFIFLLGYANAFNLIDGMDGLASGIAMFIASGLLTISFLSNQQFTIWGASSIVGASLGFLIFNSNPAKIFLGDCGSTFLGLSIAIMMCMIWLNSTNRLVLLPLIIIAGIPIFDTSSTVLRRLKHKKSLFTGDRGHLYDILMQKGYSIRQIVLLFYTLALFFSIIGIFLFILIEL